VLAVVKIDYDQDWQGATREFQRALQLSPSYPTAHHWFALHLSRLGRNEEAKTQIERALQLDPLSLIINTDAGDVFYCARKPGQALRHLERVLELDRNFGEAHLVLGKVYELKQDYPTAVANLSVQESFLTTHRTYGR
jgi:Tfp pilus assembly protein PilF